MITRTADNCCLVDAQASANGLQLLPVGSHKGRCTAWCLSAEYECCVTGICVTFGQLNNSPFRTCSLNKSAAVSAGSKPKYQPTPQPELSSNLCAAAKHVDVCLTVRLLCVCLNGLLCRRQAAAVRMGWEQDCCDQPGLAG
jgi:hypothetical protein